MVDFDQEKLAEADAALDAELAALDEGEQEAATSTPVEDEKPAETNEPEVVVDEVATTEPEPEVVPAPVGFSDEDRAWFATLPPDAQRAIARRESERDTEFGRKSQEVAESRKTYEALDKVLEPHRERYRLNGMSDAQAVGQLLAAEQYLQRSPVEALQYLARQYGVDLGKLNQQRPNPYRTLEQQMQGLRAEIAQRDQTQQTQQRQMLARQIETWGNAQDNGKPLRPHFEAVSSEMMPVLSHLRQSRPDLGMNELLAEAYDRAVYANPDVRATELDARMRTEQAKRDAAAKAKAEKAKQAASSMPSDSAGGSKPKVKTIDDAFNAALEELSG